MMSKSRNSLSHDISCAALAYEFFRPLRDLDVEEVWVLTLGPSLKFIASKMIFRGTVSACLIHPREIFRFALLTNASNIIIAHNHPSQEKHPSAADVDMTEQLILAGKLMEIPILDHLLITRQGYTSLREKAWCAF